MEPVLGMSGASWEDHQGEGLPKKRMVTLVFRKCLGLLLLGDIGIQVGA